MGSQEEARAGAGSRQGVVLDPGRLGSVFITIIYYLLLSAIKLGRAMLGNW